jgi:hypothetical protein
MERVGARGFEAPATTAPSVAGRRANDAESATRGDAKQPAVSASTPSTDEAIRAAAKLAIDVGDTTRARALLDLLEARPKPAPVLLLATKKR